MMTRLLRPIAVACARRLLGILDEAQYEDLISKFKSCGRDIKMFYPLSIFGAENMVLGDNVTIDSFTHIWGEGGIRIGNRVMIASNSVITTLTHDHSAEDMQQTLISKEIVIEDDVWIGAHCTILPGVTIGKGAVVGAGSVITKNVEPYSIVVGAPARFLKYRDVAARLKPFVQFETSGQGNENLRRNDSGRA
jgi:acetyltransferase-like isoleucine patch superfamily enzyme